MEKEKKRKGKTHMVINDNCFKDILSNILFKTENTDIILYIQNKNHRLLL